MCLEMTAEIIMRHRITLWSIHVAVLSLHANWWVEASSDFYLQHSIPGTVRSLCTCKTNWEHLAHFLFVKLSSILVKMSVTTAEFLHHHVHRLTCFVACTYQLTSWDKLAVIAVRLDLGSRIHDVHCVLRAVQTYKPNELTTNSSSSCRTLSCRSSSCWTKSARTNKW